MPDQLTKAPEYTAPIRKSRMMHNDRTERDRLDAAVQQIEVLTVALNAAIDIINKLTEQPRRNAPKTKTTSED